jgi:hypothetical protein
MAILTKNQLSASNQSSFPDNTNGEITPTILRNFNQSVIDTLVDSLDTGSFATAAITGSSLITASASGTNVITFTKGNGTQFGVTIATGSGGGGDLTSLNAFTQSQNTKDVTLASYTGSVDTKFSTIGTQSGSWDNTSLNSFTQSQDTKNSTLSTYTASVDTKFSNIGSQSGSWDNTNLNSFTQSVDTKFVGVGSSTSSLNSFTSSQDTKNSTLATYTGSNDTKWSNLGSQSGSFVTESETGSFARTNVANTFTATQTINADLIVSGTINAYKINTTIESSSVIYSSGSNQFGDASDDIQTLYGSVRVINSLTASGLSYPSADGIAGQFITTNGAGTLSFDDVHAILEHVRYGESITIGDPLYVSGSNGNVPIVFKADAAIASKMPVIYVATSTATTNTNTTALTLGLITGVTTSGYPVGTTIYVGEGGGWSASRPSGSASIVQSLGIVTKEGPGGSGRGLVLNPGPATLPNLGTGYAWVGDGANQPVSVATSSFGSTINTGSFATTGSNAFFGTNTFSGAVAFTGSAPTILSSSFSGSIITNLTDTYTDVAAVNQIVTLTSASYAALASGSLTNPNTLYIVSGSTSGSTTDLGPLNTFTASQETKDVTLGLLTGSFATTGSNTFTGDQTFTDTAANTITLTDVSGSFGVINGNIDSVFNVLGNAGANPNARLGGNLLFKNAVNQSGSLVVSGSGNILTGMPTVATGFRNQLSANNIGSTAPSVSSSMAFPVNINSNIIQSGLTFRGPVSSSAYNISTNYFGGAVTLGSSAANNFEKGIAGVTMTQNVINAAVSAIANTTNLTSAFSIINSNINQALTINATSSSVQIANSNMGGASATITNRAFHTGSNNHMIIASTLTSGQTTAINSDGAPATNVTHGVVASLLGGSGTTIQLGAVGVTSDSMQLRNSIVFGLQLQVTGSNSAAASTAQGSAFVGRQNSTDAGKNDSSRVVFAVGTGTDTTTGRKTGFLIDSGSNTFVEGTLNVSGGVFQNVVPVTIASSTASLDLRAGTYFTLTLADNTTTHINPTNLEAGVSATLVITTGTNSSASLSPTLLQPSGSAYSATVGSSKIDVLSLVSINTGSMFVVSTKNMI